jgi:hypothetical protein
MLSDLAQAVPDWLLLLVLGLSAFSLACCVAALVGGMLLARRRDEHDRVAIAESPPECWDRRCPVCDCQALSWRWLIWHIDREHLEEALLAEDVGIAMLRQEAAA